MEEKNITDDVSIETYNHQNGEIVVCHYCKGRQALQGSRLMLLRENEEGPVYWCTGCGYVLDEGVAMAIRLNEVDI